MSWDDFKNYAKFLPSDNMQFCIPLSTIDDVILVLFTWEADEPRL